MAPELKVKKRKAPAEESKPVKKVKKAEAARPKSILKKPTVSADTSATPLTTATARVSKAGSKPSRKPALDSSDTKQDVSGENIAATGAPAKPKKAKASSDYEKTSTEPATKKLKKAMATDRSAHADGARATLVKQKPKTLKESSKESRQEPQPEAIDDKVLVVEDEHDEEPEDDQTAALLAGFESSEDEDAADGEGFTSDLKVPSLPADNKMRKKLDAVAHSDNDQPGVIYVGRIPHGFYEHQMRAYFSQFGDITRLRLSRNRRTGASKHYAFVEFASSEVAQIVADTMNNYLMFGHILKARMIPKQQVHEELFKGANRRFKVVPRNMLEGKKLKSGMPREGWEKRIGIEEKRRREKTEKLKEIGYEYEMPALKSISEVPVREKGGAAAIEASEQNMVSEKAFESATAKNLALDAAGNQLLTELAEDGAKSPEATIITEEPNGSVKTKVMKIDQDQKRKRVAKGDGNSQKKSTKRG